MSDSKFMEKSRQGIEERLLNFPDVVPEVFQSALWSRRFRRFLAQTDGRTFLLLTEALLASEKWNSAISGEYEDVSSSEAETWLELFVETFRAPQEPSGVVSRWTINFIDALAPVPPLPSSRRLLLEALALLLGLGSWSGADGAYPEVATRLRNAAATLSPLQEEWAAGFRGSWRRLAALAEVRDRPALLSFEPAASGVSLPSAWLVGSRRNLLGALEQAESVAQQARHALQMTSRSERQAALAIAAEECLGFRDQQLSPVPILEYRILQSALNHWLNLLVEIGAKEAHVARPALENPYIAGRPVTGQGFFDREEILNRLGNRVLSGQSIMLIGHRRSGKTSILMEFAEHVTEEWLPVYLTMERLLVAGDSGALLYRIMLRIDEVLSRHEVATPELETSERFRRDVPEGVDRYLKGIIEAIHPRRLVLCLDEYEGLEEGLQQGKYNRDDVEYFVRGWLLSEGMLSVIVAGPQGPRQLRERFSQPIFARLPPEWVDLLAESDARQLITNPVPDFPVNYEPEVVERILKLTSGQPYLIQLIGQALIDGLIEMLKRNPDRAWTITMADLEGALGTQHYEKGNFYYGQVWHEAGESGRALLTALATPETNGKTAEELSAAAGMASEAAHAMLQELVDQHILAYDDRDRVYTFAIPLMRRWVEHTHAKERG